MKQLFDQAIFTENNAYLPFALTDVFTEHANATSQEIIHFWQCDQTFILGMKDTRVPHLQQGLSQVFQDNYQSVVRNSGGLGVIADKGVLNVSLIFPREEDTTTDSAYEQMMNLTQQAFPELKVAAYEISESYCPGTFDLSIDGKKIAGIAQRRVKNGVAVMMYLSVNGNQHQRGEVVRNFYQQSLKEKFGTDGYPAVDPACMTTIETALGQPMSIQQTKKRFIQTLNIQPTAIDPLHWVKEALYTELLEKKLASMRQRNLQIKELHDGYSL